LACSVLPDSISDTHKASAVDNLPGFPHDTGFAARTSGNVRGMRLVFVDISLNDSPRLFHEQSSATIAAPRSMSFRSSGPSNTPELIEGQGANVIRLETPPGENATFDQVKEAFDNNNDVKAFYVVHNETSTGTMVNYLDKVSDLTSRNDSMYIVDSVSLLGGASLPVDKWNIDVCMTGSQKAIAAPPGISPISISPKAKKYMIENPPATMYFNLARYFKYYEESKHTPFTPALPLLYAYREALSILLEEGLENVFNRHKICSDALYAGLSALGLTPFAKEEDRSITIVALNYLDGLEDKTFRNTLAQKFRVLVAGGFGNLKGKVFRVGCMGEVQRYHVMRTISSIASTLDMMGYNVDTKAGLSIAEEKLKAL